MVIAAVPSYMGKDFSSASPGQRFSMFMPLWEEIKWTLPKDGKAAALKQALALSEADKHSVRALAKRQRALADSIEATGQLLRLDAITTAPFATGLGNEHPLENGFAFLNPYGLPYLPGSGVKGVLRAAARELANGVFGGTEGWSDTHIEALFGRESEDGETDHRRGALIFWDVIPQLKGDALKVDVMTPHQTHYYQGKESPHDSGSPNPIPILTVPPGSAFAFHVQCNRVFLARIEPTLLENDQWKLLINTAFRHAFDWLGFGAKTAVGYGAMAEDPKVKADRYKRESEARADAKRQAEQARRATLSPEDQAWEDHRPAIDAFRKEFDSARSSAYQPGSKFDNQRSDFIKLVTAWSDLKSRRAAAELLQETTTKEWGTPSNKERRQRIKNAVDTLSGQP